MSREETYRASRITGLIYQDQQEMWYLWVSPEDSLQDARARLKKLSQIILEDLEAEVRDGHRKRYNR